MAERARAKEAATAHIQRASKLDYSKRLEKVWRHLESVASRAEKDFLEMEMVAEERTTSFTDAELEKREAAMDLAKGRAATAREAWEACLTECGVRIPGAPVDED